jgi:hypothetical protein
MSGIIVIRPAPIEMPGADSSAPPRMSDECEISNAAAAIRDLIWAQPRAAPALHKTVGQTSRRAER